MRTSFEREGVLSNSSLIIPLGTGYSRDLTPFPGDLDIHFCHPAEQNLYKLNIEFINDSRIQPVQHRSVEPQDQAFSYGNDVFIARADAECWDRSKYGT